MHKPRPNYPVMRSAQLCPSSGARGRVDATAVVLAAVLVFSSCAAFARAKASGEIRQTIQAYAFETQAGEGKVLWILWDGERLYLERTLFIAPGGERFSIVTENITSEGRIAISFLQEDSGWWASVEVDMGLGQLPDVGDPSYFPTVARRLREEDPLIEIVLQTIDGSYWHLLESASNETEIAELLLGEDHSVASDSTPAEVARGLWFLSDLFDQGFMGNIKNNYLELVLEALAPPRSAGRTIEGYWVERSQDEVREHLRQFGSLTASERSKILSLLPKEP